MPYELIVVWSVVGFGFVAIAGRWLGADPHTVFGGLFAAQGARDWPTGVQESDAPRFAVAHLDTLRPQRAATAGEAGIDGEIEPAQEVVELGVRHLDRGR